MSWQALVFDLDDTLMDTYGQLVMDAHRQACVAMQQKGLDIPLETLLATRLRLLKEQPRAEINSLLASHFDQAEPEIIQAGFETYFNPEITVLEPFPGVHELLESLKSKHALFLVTAGSARTQARKVEVLGIGHYFEEIIYVPLDQPDGKYESFKTLQQKYAYRFEKMVIIGDRISNEIAAGNRLGCPTIWMQHGECLHDLPAGPHEEPCLTTRNIAELPQLLGQLLRSPSAF